MKIHETKNVEKVIDLIYNYDDNVANTLRKIDETNLFYYNAWREDKRSIAIVVRTRKEKSFALWIHRDENTPWISSDRRKRYFEDLQFVVSNDLTKREQDVAKQLISILEDAHANYRVMK